jgi:hypothetical protein
MGASAPGCHCACPTQRLASAELDGIRWYWPADESAATSRSLFPEAVRLLAPFDPVVWDRRRFELFWGWAYRFEAYTPASQRQRGYYAMPLLWRDQVIGWANLALRDGQLDVRAWLCGRPRPRRCGLWHGAGGRTGAHAPISGHQRGVSGRGFVTPEQCAFYRLPTTATTATTATRAATTAGATV